MRTHDLKLGFRFHAPDLGIRRTPDGAFIRSLQEVQRAASMGRSELEEMARKAREAGK
jgi:hypothetical protein